MFWVADNSQEIGQFTAADLTSLWTNGTISATACYWLPGMTEWRPVEEILAYEAPDFDTAQELMTTAVVEPKGKLSGKKPNKSHLNFLMRRGISTEGLSREAAAAMVQKTKHEERLQRSLATPRQKACLEYHGIQAAADLSRDEASAIMDGIDFSESKWMHERHVRYPDLYDEPTMVAMSERQSAFLDYHGIEYDAQITGQEASVLIQKVINDPAHADSGWNERKYELHPRLFNEGW